MRRVAGRQVRERSQRQLAVGTMVTPAVVVGIGTAAHLASSNRPLLGQAIATLAILGLALPLLVGNYWLLRTEWSARALWRVTAWSLSGALPLTALAGFTVVYQRVQGVALADPWLVTSWVAGAGAVGGLLTGVYDVRRTRKRNRLNEVYSRLEAILETSPLALVSVDPDGAIRQWNQAAEELFGYSRDEVVGEAYPLHPENERVRETAREDRLETRVDGVDTKRQHADGSLVNVSVWAAPIRDADDLVGQVILLADVTERKQKEQRLNVLNRALRHNLRNGVAVIQENARLLADEVDENRFQASVETIDNAAQELIDLGEKAREAERALRVSDDGGQTDITTLLERICSEFRQVYPDAEITLDTCEDATVVGPNRLEVAFREVVENAVEHADGDPTVDIAVARSSERITVSVSDDGPGISDYERRILETGTETPLEHSSGLGLWVTYWVVQRLGGDVHISGDDGTTVTIELPAE